MLNCLLKQSHNFPSRLSSLHFLALLLRIFCSKIKFLVLYVLVFASPQGTFKLILQKTYTFHVDVVALLIFVLLAFPLRLRKNSLSYPIADEDIKTCSEFHTYGLLSYIFLFVLSLSQPEHTQRWEEKEIRRSFPNKNVWQNCSRFLFLYAFTMVFLPLLLDCCCCCCC